MSALKRWKKRLRAVFRQDAVDREMDEELAFHLELEIRKNEGLGMSPAEARRQAALTFGGVERYKEQVRDARVLSWVGGMSLDFYRRVGKAYGKDAEDDVFRAAEELGIDLSRREPSSVEEV